MYMSKTNSLKNHELVDVFLDTPIEIPNATKSLVPPRDGMLFNEKDQQFYYYNKGAWHHLPTGDMKTGTIARMLDFFLTDTPNLGGINTTTSKIVDIYLSLIRRFPNRLDITEKDPPLTALLDKTINLHTGILKEHSNKDKCFHSLPFQSSQLLMDTPNFDFFINTAFPDEPKMKTLFLEVIIHYLLPEVQEKAAFYLYGLPRTGKSTFMDFMELLIGEEHRSSFPLQSLTGQGSRETTAQLAGKKINLVDEDESTYVKADKLKALISNRAIEARRLYQSTFTFKPQTKFLFASNEYPKIMGAEGGLKRRLHFIEFKNEIEQKDEIKEFELTLFKETPGILRQAIIAGYNFRKRNHIFSFTPSMAITKAEFFRESSPVLKFIEESCTVSPEFWTSNQDLYSHYQDWCDRNGHKQLNSGNCLKQIDRELRIKEKRRCNVRGRPLEITKQTITPTQYAHNNT